MHPFHSSETLTIRKAVSADAEALRRLAQLVALLTERTRQIAPPRRRPARRLRRPARVRRPAIALRA
jgi:hypothetical protein